ncbi:hypothetical protein BCR42DRAFT_409270 [Absidia repens]|uniref:Uncharacterized protein n=1 Tax=Absidia repens TaxID=90262 RepID=A0A1X2IQW7_9FUNG|nr:hypothetical protein BCR42DRAFT_409270 [Absidia repens]
MSTTSAIQQPIPSIRNFYAYVGLGITLTATTAYVIYQLIEDDRQVKQKKQTKRAERQILQLIHQIQVDRQTINKDIEGLTGTLLHKAEEHNNKVKSQASDCDLKKNLEDSDGAALTTVDTLTTQGTNSGKDNDSNNNTMDDKEWKRHEFVLAECNELLLRLMERLDAIRPKSAIIGEDVDGQVLKEPNDLEEAAILDIRNRKKKVIRQIERNFRQLDQCKDLMNRLLGGYQ